MHKCLVVAATGAAAVVIGGLGRWLRRSQKTGTLWAFPMSTCSRRVILALEESGVTGYTFHPIDLFKREQKTELYLTMQPYGKVPVWQEEDKGLTLFESRAIMRHVAAGSALIPTDPALEALMDQWISVEYSCFYPEFVVLYRRARTSRTSLLALPPLQQQSLRALPTNPSQPARLVPPPLTTTRFQLPTSSQGAGAEHALHWPRLRSR